jgi:hypothetical protein
MKSASGHPVLTAIIIGGGVIAIAPRVVTVPVLYLVGFGVPGVMISS